MRGPARVLLGAVACWCGCGGGGSLPGDGGVRPDARVGGGARMSWQFDGEPRTALVVTAARRKDSGIDFLSLTGASATGEGIAIQVADLTPNKPDVLGGAYSCPGSGNQEVIFTYTKTGAGFPMSCTVTIAQPGAVGSQNAVGTFAAVLANGQSITDGQFDTPVIRAP